MIRDIRDLTAAELDQISGAALTCYPPPNWPISCAIPPSEGRVVGAALAGALAAARKK